MVNSQRKKITWAFPSFIVSTGVFYSKAVNLFLSVVLWMQVINILLVSDNKCSTIRRPIVLHVQQKEKMKFVSLSDRWNSLTFSASIVFAMKSKKETSLCLYTSPDSEHEGFKQERKPTTHAQL